MQIEQLIQQLQAQGLANDQIIQSLEQMVTENRITSEDLEKAKLTLNANQATQEPQDQEQVDKERIGKWFNMKF